MNYLAHLYLARLTNTSLTGNFLGDFVRGRVIDLELAAEYKNGIFLHRKIDVFTDSHPRVRSSYTKLSDQRRRFAGIIIDIAYDHLLATEWHQFSSISLEDFVEDFYNEVSSKNTVLPKDSQKIISHMIEGNWLVNYRHLAGVDYALNGLSRRYKKRFGRENPLAGAVVEVEKNLKGLREDFLGFFPELIVHAQAMVKQYHLDRAVDNKLAGKRQ